jgi:hypothetical protein
MLDPNSPLLSLPVLDMALKGATDATSRVQILSARVQVLSRDVPTKDADAATAATYDPTRLLVARLDLAEEYLTLNPPDRHTAAAEAGVVELDCKRLQKRAERLTDASDTPAWMDQIRPIRKRAALLLANIDAELGRASRADRWKKLAEEL